MQQEADVNVFQQDLADMKGEHKALEQRVSALERVSDRQDQQIMTLNEKLNKIEENTRGLNAPSQVPSLQQCLQASLAEPSPLCTACCSIKGGFL